MVAASDDVTFSCVPDTLQTNPSPFTSPPHPFFATTPSKSHFSSVIHFAFRWDKMGKAQNDSPILAETETVFVCVLAPALMLGCFLAIALYSTFSNLLIDQTV